MNWVDLVIIIVLLVFALQGFGKSFIFELVDLFGFLVAFIASLKYYNLLSELLQNVFSLPHSLASVFGFIVVWFVIETLTIVVLRILIIKFSINTRSSLDKIFGFIPALAKGLIFVAILLVVTATFPIQPKIKSDVKDSKIGSLILTKTYQLEVPIKNVFGGLAKDTLTFLTIEPKTNESVALGFTTNDFSFSSDIEMRMVDLVNKEREKQGVAKLIFDPKLRDVGRGHSGDMFKRGYFAHYSPEGQTVVDRATKEGSIFLVIGENLAYAPSLDLAHQGLMNSPGHRANILSTDYRHIGIGVAQTEELGIMFTQVFKD